MTQDHGDALNKLNKALEEDESFRAKFNEIFTGDEKTILQAVDAAAEEADVTGQAGCSCMPYVCGKGCFSSYPGSRGYSQG